MIKSNSIVASIKSDTALAAILSNFETSYIVNMVRDTIKMRFRPYNTPLPTLYSIESSFISLLNNVDVTYREKIMEVREETYKEIILEICKYYNVDINIDTEDDIYSQTFWLYDFFVSNFTDHFIDFFVNYIILEKNSIYEYLNLESYRKEKSTSINYSKKVFENDIKLAMIHANLGLVIDNICNSFDIDLETYINYSLADPSVKTYLLQNVKEIDGDTFKRSYASLYSPEIYMLYYNDTIYNYQVDILTSVKLRLQEKIMNDYQILNAV